MRRFTAAFRNQGFSRIVSACAWAGLGTFVLMVGPDASVLRASLMGAIALASLAGGRAGRGLSSLCLAVIALLLSDPALGTSFGFLLSVLATLGIIVLGRRIVDWVPPAVPRCADRSSWCCSLSSPLIRCWPTCSWPRWWHRSPSWGRPPTAHHGVVLRPDRAGGPLQDGLCA